MNYRPLIIILSFNGEECPSSLYLINNVTVLESSLINIIMIRAWRKIKCGKLCETRHMCNSSVYINQSLS